VAGAGLGRGAGAVGWVEKGGGRSGWLSVGAGAGGGGGGLWGCCVCAGGRMWWAGLGQSMEPSRSPGVAQSCRAASAPVCLRGASSPVSARRQAVP